MLLSTTEPPSLSPDHPLRRAFYQYGAAAARHWLTFILCSVATAVLFCYPVFFLYENPTTGFHKLPYHVWTSARLYDGNPNTRPDVEIRQVWVHGSYMKALQTNVLRESLSIQETLMASGSRQQGDRTEQKPVNTGANELSDACASRLADDVFWGFHSPLMFWNCSSSAVATDTDLLHTINSQGHRRSNLNLTLRPTSVFAGKSFVKDKVVAADALVITLFHHPGEKSNEQWSDHVDELAKDVPSRWSLYPQEGHHLTQSRLYEFQQKPLSLQDNFFLFLSYLLMTVYVLLTLGKLRAVKSKIGLVVTVIFEVSFDDTGATANSNNYLDSCFDHSQFFHMRDAPDRPSTYSGCCISICGSSDRTGKHVSSRLDETLVTPF
jgi:hypothetical protein